MCSSRNLYFHRDIVDFLQRHRYSLISLKNNTRNKQKTINYYEMCLREPIDETVFQEQFQFFFSLSSPQIQKMEHACDETVPKFICHFKVNLIRYPAKETYSDLLRSREWLHNYCNRLYMNQCKILLKNNSKPECPVCYFELTVENIIIPDCTHEMCKSCYTKCTNCPICRGELYPLLA